MERPATAESRESDVSSRLQDPGASAQRGSEELGGDRFSVYGLSSDEKARARSEEYFGALAGQEVDVFEICAGLFGGSSWGRGKKRSVCTALLAASIAREASAPPLVGNDSFPKTN